MGGGTIFRGMARVVGVAAVGAAAVPSAGAHCHVHQPTLRHQENLSAMLNLSQKEVYDSPKGLHTSLELLLDEDNRNSSLVEKREETSQAIESRQLVLSPPPTEEEVQEATRELQAALNFSIPAPTVVFDADSLGSCEENIDRGPRVPERRVTDTSLPPFQTSNHLGALVAESGSVMKAFQLLQTNPKVQDVVKSLACDPGVWNAVLSNEKVQELTQEDPHDLHAFFADGNAAQYDIKESDDMVESREWDESLITQKPHGLVWRSRVYYNYVRGKVLSIMNSMLGKVLSIMNSMFGSVEKKINSKEGVSAKDKTVASCIMLAVAVLIVVVVRRTMTNGRVRSAE